MEIKEERDLLELSSTLTLMCCDVVQINTYVSLDAP